MPAPSSSRKNLSKARQKLQAMIQEAKANEEKKHEKNDRKLVVEAQEPDLESSSDNGDSDESDDEPLSPPPPPPQKQRRKHNHGVNEDEIKNLILNEFQRLQGDLHKTVKSASTDLSLDRMRQFLRTN